jgi:sirohydrochlorin ferrochelatase
MPKPSGNTLILLRFCDVKLPAVGNRASHVRALGLLAIAILLAVPAFAVSHSAAPTSDDKQLEKLARALRNRGNSAYAQLSVFATRKKADVLGQRAALALGYYDYVKGRYAPARHWLEQAQGDPILREYALYWSALVSRAQRYNEKAL